MIKRLIITTCCLCVLFTPLPLLAESEVPAPWHKRLFNKSTPSSSKDIWAHIQGNLDIDTNATNPSVKTQYKWYSQNTDYLTRTLGRAQPYLYHIVTELEARDMPLALALIPIVESDFNPQALSPVGAAGLWQLMPATARHLGVERNSYYDGRRDLMDSTRAAINHLSYLNRFFEGDWLLVLAAYNAGEGTVQRAIKNNQRAGKKTDFWSLTLPRETRLYVPKILALAEVISDPDKVNLELPYIPHAPMYDWVEVEQSLDLKKAASMAELPWADFKHMNSGYHKSTLTLPKGTHRLYLPIENASYLKASLDNQGQARAAPAPAAASADSEQLLNKITYRVRSGDSINKIATQFKVSPTDLKAWNELSEKHMLHPGESLIVYVDEGKRAV